MGQFRASANDFASALGQVGSKIYAALKAGIEGYDYDSGWVPTPAGGIFNHGLTTLPRFVQVHASSNANGNPYGLESVNTVSTSQIVTGVGAPFHRVLANR